MAGTLHVVVAVPPTTAVAALVQYVVLFWVIVNVTLPELMELAWMVDGRLTSMKAVKLRLVSPGCRLASKVWVLVAAGPTARVVEAGGEPRVLHTVRGAGYVLRAG